MIPKMALMVGVLGCSLLIVGCGGETGPKTYVLSGKVTLDGKPLETGDITLRPVGPTGQGAGGKIVNGSYSLRATPGEMKVEVSSMKYLSGQTSDNPAGVGGPLFEELVPPKYNSDTKLSFNVAPKNDNKFDIDIKH
ncbi:MAG: hypothetical protein V4719_31720 [Planctomycetota bacterium]